IHQLDSSHPRLLVLGTQSTTSSPQANPNWSIFANGTEVMGQDWYPLGDSAIGTMSQAGQLAGSVQAAADSLGKQSALVLQQMSWQEYYPPSRCTPWPSCAPFPTFSQLQQMLNDTLHNASPRLVLYYSFFDIWGPNYEKVIGDYENSQGHWNDLSTLVESFYITPTPTPGPTTPPTSYPTPTPRVTIIEWPTIQPSTPPPPPQVSLRPYQEEYHSNPNEYVRPSSSSQDVYPTLAVEPLGSVQSNKSLTGQLFSFIFSINDMISGSVKNLVFMFIRPTLKH
ncbi:MAG: hypothetical protein KGL95_15030, partial [Patescibacteria group bacterium]|nr:hypothetical protein [Patescibacteria group bacterium]